VVLPGVHLSLDPTDAWVCGTHDDEQVLAVEADALVRSDDLNMGQSLKVGAHRVLALDDHHSIGAQDAVGFNGSSDVGVNDAILPCQPTFRGGAPFGDLCTT